jgi:hypothetical protein
VPVSAVSPVSSSVAETLDRWCTGERAEVLCSKFLEVLASVPDQRDSRGADIAGRAAGSRGPDHHGGDAGLCPVRRLDIYGAGGFALKNAPTGGLHQTRLNDQRRCWSGIPISNICRAASIRARLLAPAIHGGADDGRFG